jgi:hypothetical protein
MGTTLVSLDADPDVMRFATGGVLHDQTENEVLPAFLGHGSALRHLPASAARAALAPGEATGLGELSGLPPAVDGPCARGQLWRRALAGPGPDQGSEVRAAVRYRHYDGQYWRSQTVQAALRPSACSS